MGQKEGVYRGIYRRRLVWIEWRYTECLRGTQDDVTKTREGTTTSTRVITTGGLGVSPGPVCGARDIRDPLPNLVV